MFGNKKDHNVFCISLERKLSMVYLVVLFVLFIRYTAYSYFILIFLYFKLSPAFLLQFT